jgi:hypothetical protein
MPPCLLKQGAGATGSVLNAPNADVGSVAVVTLILVNEK